MVNVTAFAPDWIIVLEYGIQFLPIRIRSDWYDCLNIL